MVLANLNGKYGNPSSRRIDLERKISGTTATRAFGSWTTQTTPAYEYSSVCWSKEVGLFVAVASGTVTGSSGQRAMTSPDGKTWTVRTTTDGIGSSPISFSSVCWSPEHQLFVAVATDGVGTRAITSPDGINWTKQTTAQDNAWRAICFSPELGRFCAVSSDGTNRVMTSDNGTTWTARTAAAANSWQTVCWSSDLNLFLALSNDGTSNRCMTSSDGITWTSRATAADVAFTHVIWMSDIKLFLAVANSSANVQVSPDGVNWFLFSHGLGGVFVSSAVYCPELSLYGVISGTGTNRVSYSGSLNFGLSPSISFTALSVLPTTNTWRASCWSPEKGIVVVVGNTANSTTNAAISRYVGVTGISLPK